MVEEERLLDDFELRAFQLERQRDASVVVAVTFAIAFVIAVFWR